MKNFKKILCGLLVAIIFVSSISLFSFNAFAGFGKSDVFVIENFDNVSSSTYWTGPDKNDLLPYKVVTAPSGIIGKGIELRKSEVTSTNIYRKTNFANHFSTPIDISKYTNGKYALKVRIYFDEFNWPNGDQDNDWGVELTSLGGPDRSSYRWGKGAFLFQKGWNEVYLPLTENYKIKALGTLNPAAINYIRVFSTYNQTEVTVLDSISIVDFSPNQITQNENVLTIDSCEDQSGFILGALGSNAKVGIGAIYGGAWGADQIATIMRKWATPIDTKSTMENGLIKVWIYISAPNNIREFQFEATSSGQADNSELGWTKDEITLKSGWNEYSLEFKKAKKTAGDAERDFNPAKLDYIRFYAIATNPVLIGVDDIKIILPKTANTQSGQTSNSVSNASTSKSNASSNVLSSIGDANSQNIDSLSSQNSENTSNIVSDNATNSNQNQRSMIWIFIVLGVITLLGGGAAIYFFVIRKKN